MKKKVIIISGICLVTLLLVAYYMNYRRLSIIRMRNDYKILYFSPEGSVFENHGKEWTPSSNVNKMDWFPSIIDTINPVGYVKVNSSLTGLEYYFIDAVGRRLDMILGIYYFKKGHTLFYKYCDSSCIVETKKYKLPQTPKRIYDKYHDKLKNKGKLITTWDRFVNGTVTLEVFEIIEKREYLISIREDSKRFLVLYMNDKMYYFRNETKPAYEAGYFVILKNKGLKVDK
jgi:hypothetical protein